MTSGKDSGDAPFAGLPSGFAGELLSRSKQVANDLFSPYREISAGRETFRHILREKNLLGKISAVENIPAACGIDWCFSPEMPPSSKFIYASAFAIDGLAPSGGAGQWNTPQHRLFYSARTQSAKSSPVLHALSLEFAAVLAASAPHEIVLANDSWALAFISVMGALKNAMEEKDSPEGKEFIRQFKPAIAAFSKIFNASASHWAGIPRNSAKREIMAELNGSAGYDDATFFTIVLEPGEYAGPVPAGTGEVESISRLSIKDENFAAVRDGVVNSIRELRVVHFRPRQWTPAMRIEIPRPAADDPEILNRLLAGVQYQCRTPGMSRPYPLESASAMTRDLLKSAPAIRQTLAAQLTKTDRESMGDLFTLLM
jgi:hypothetical protein